MGICTSCCNIEPQTAMIMNGDGTFRQVKLPITAADLMLLEPGQLIASIDSLRRSIRYEAMPADQQLSAGKIYMFIPATKLHSKLSQSDRAKLHSVCHKKRQAKRRSSKVIPSSMDGAAKFQLPILGENVTGYRTQWKPVLEPIFESF